MEIRNCMKRSVVSIQADKTIREAAEVVVNRHVGILPVVDEFGKPVGVVRLSDLLELELPDFIQLVEDFDFVHDFGAIETTRPTKKELAQTVSDIMEPVLTIEETCGLLRAYATMLRNEIFDLPVTNKNGELVGLISRVDVGSAILSLWPKR
ncbi:MAG: CBS domain-containing protein [Anaerolineae bacterium]|nr:CBS domain-containing protein [Anaerolineae bacterium]